MGMEMGATDRGVQGVMVGLVEQEAGMVEQGSGGLGVWVGWG